MRRMLLLAAGIALAGALLVPTIASPFDAGDDVDELDDGEIAMTPSDGPNGVYAYNASTEDGEYELALHIGEHNQERAESAGGEGVNENAITEIDDIFRVASTGDEDLVWNVSIEADVDDVRFYYDNDSTNQFTEPATLEADEELSVGLLVDTRGDHDVEHIEEFTIHAYPVSEEETTSQSPDSPSESGPQTVDTDDGDQQADNTETAPGEDTDGDGGAGSEEGDIEADDGDGDGEAESEGDETEEDGGGDGEEGTDGDDTEGDDTDGEPEEQSGEDETEADDTEEEPEEDDTEEEPEEEPDGDEATDTVQGTGGVEDESTETLAGAPTNTFSLLLLAILFGIAAAFAARRAL